MRPLRTDYDRGVDFEGLDAVEQRMGVSAVNMSADQVLTYFERLYADRFGERLAYNPAHVGRTAKRFKRDYGDNAGRLVKWFFFRLDGMRYDHKKGDYAPADISWLQKHNDQFCRDQLAEVKLYREKRLDEMVAGVTDTKIKGRESGFMGLKALRGES